MFTDSPKAKPASVTMTATLDRATATATDYLGRNLPRSRHLPVAVVEGNLTKNLNKTGVRLWPIGSDVTRKIDSFGDTVMDRSRRASNASRRPSSCEYCGFLIFSHDVERLSV